MSELRAENIERWTVMLATGELTPAGYKKLVSKMDVHTKPGDYQTGSRG